MRLTSKGRYAVTAMLDVALHSKTGPVPLADISERQGISLSYLEQLFSRLRKTNWLPVSRPWRRIFIRSRRETILSLKLFRLLMSLLMQLAVTEEEKDAKVESVV